MLQINYKIFYLKTFNLCVTGVNNEKFILVNDRCQPYVRRIKISMNSIGGLWASI